MAGDAAPLRDPEKDVVNADPLQITWWAALAGSATAIIAFVIAILDELNALEVSENIKIALVGLIGAGIIGWAISSAADALAKVYSTAHVTPEVTQTTSEGVEKKTPARPAIQTAADTLAKGYGAAHGVPATGAPAAAAPAPAAEQQFVPLPLLTVQVGDDAQAKAVLALVKDDKTVEYLVGLNGQQLGWKPQSEVRIPSQSTPPSHTSDAS